jgi:hypothetical protein
MVVWAGRILALAAALAVGLQPRPPGRFPWWRFLSLVALTAFFWTPWHVISGSLAVALGIVATARRLTPGPGTTRQRTIESGDPDTVELMELIAWGAFIWSIRPL